MHRTELAIYLPSESFCFMSDDVTDKTPPSLLVVDDDANIRQIMRLLLEAAGYHVHCAADGKEAMKFVEAQSFDLILTDILMPGSDGLELLSAMKKSRLTTRVVVMSGGGMIGVADYLKLANKLGAHGVLEKPFTSETLLATVANLLKKRTD